MTASPEALAPSRRPSPRAVVLAILGMGLFVLLGYAAIQYATPSDSRSVVPVPILPGATRIKLDDRWFWLTRDTDGRVFVLNEEDRFGKRAEYVRQPRLGDGAECTQAGYFRGFDDYTLAGIPLLGPSQMYRHHIEVIGDKVSVDLSRAPELAPHSKKLIEPCPRYSD